MPPFLSRWLFALFLLALLAASRLPEGAARAAGRWPRAAVEFVVLPAAGPFQKLCASLPGIAPSSPEDAADPAQVREKLAWSLREVELLKAQLRAEREASRWFEQIQPFVKFSEVTPIPVGVATGSFNPKRPLFTLTGGHESGVLARQMVIGDGAEVIGITTDSVSPFSAEVRALTWPGTVLECRAVPPDRSGDGIRLRLKAQEEGGAFEGDVERQAAVAPGDEVILDDLSFGGHARGFVVGRVEKILDPHPDPDRNLFYKRLIIRPQNNLSRVSRVIVLAQKQGDGADAGAKAPVAMPPVKQGSVRPDAAKDAAKKEGAR